MKKKENKKEKKIMVCVKMTEKEHTRLKALAEKWTGGNLSLWLRAAGLSYYLNMDEEIKNLGNI